MSTDITISAAHADARLIGTRDFLDAGVNVARVEIYSSPRPANGASPTGATKLVTLPLEKPSGAVASGVLTLSFDMSADVLVVASGIANWARWITANGSHAMDSDVSDLTGTALVRMSSTTLYEGGKVTVASASLG